MLFETLNTLKLELSSYLSQLPEESNFTITEENIAFHETSADVKDSMVLSLIRMEEEATLKNMHQYRKEAGKTIYSQPPVNMNLYILFSSVFDTYGNALKNLSNVVKFFQTKRTFNAANTPNTQVNMPSDFELHMDLYSPSFDMSNHIWGSLGGKQFPSVIYKVRLVSLERDLIQEQRPLIQDLEGNINSY